MTAGHAAGTVPEERATSPGRGNVTLAVVSTAAFMAMLDNLAVTNALPGMGENLGLGISGLQWVVASYTLVLAATLLSAGAVGDRLGQRWAFLSGLLGFMAGSALSSLATTLAAMVTGRIVQGLGAAVLLPAGTALLRHTYPDASARARALGVRGAVGGLGVALGPAFGGLLTQALGWRSVMWINLPIGAVALVAAWRVLPCPPTAPARWDPAGQALAVTGLGSLVYGLMQGPVDGWSAPGTAAALTVAALALPAFALVETRVPRPLLDPGLFRDRECRAVTWSCFSSSAGLFGGIFFLSLFLQNVLGWSPAGAGVVFLSASAFIVLASPVAAALTVRFGVGVPLSLGLALDALALAGLSCFGRHASFADYWWLLPVLGAGTGLLFVPATITLVDRAPPAHAGAASAVVDTLREVGGVVGVAALGAVLTAHMRGALRDRVVRAGFPRDATEHLVRNAVADGPAHRLPGAGASRITVWAQESFADGLHLALRCGALILTGTLVLVLVLLSRRHGCRTRREVPRTTIGRPDG
ncbi:MFS transporter [Streptomyces eurocidicus]|uniref:EmrB/QacA subfamily drug resistance transporter n=1 Tax=Streptomyces eurocidicus TaxID=66423 RepID=A0A7W8F2U5_STREU|nr:MFS transporter [Streptomyces eurocidicus]MBB5119359.1 EmrB/QacA subfamily drug resistance transporter [Streptomyces eurocidicus]MBF6053062.1 DHA2 family efflux MFS transporter permease subunit [Streptomyces eurocidicus]